MVVDQYCDVAPRQRCVPAAPCVLRAQRFDRSVTAHERGLLGRYAMAMRVRSLIADFLTRPLLARRRHARSGPGRDRRRASKRLGLVPALAVFACAGCGQASTSPSNAPVATERAPAASPVAQHTHTRKSTRGTPLCRSMPPRHPSTSHASSNRLGSCSESDLSAVLAAVARFRRTVTTGGNVCDLLTPYLRANAERWAHQPLPPSAPPAIRHHQTCGAMAMYDGSATAFRGTNPIGEVLTFPASPHAAFESRVGSVPRGAIVSFAPQAHSAGLNIVVVAMGPKWLIDQVGYRF